MNNIFHIMYLVVMFLSSEVAPVHPELGISAASLRDQNSEGEEGGEDSIPASQSTNGDIF